jgi:hypothetical protein
MPTKRHGSGRSFRRREFLKAAAAGVAAPYVVTSAALGGAGRPGAADRTTLGFIGVGNRGEHLLRWIGGDSQVQVVGVCDTNAWRLSIARQRANAHYAGRARGTYEGCAAYRDFRRLLARDDVDGVVIATPDHWHGLLSTLAARAGKDIYCEKRPGSDAGNTGPPFRAHAAAVLGGRPEGPEGLGRRREPPDAGLLLPGAPKGRKELA